MRKKYSRKKGPVVSKKVTYDGIKFASGLEKYMYVALKEAKIHAMYEGTTFELQDLTEESLIQRCIDDDIEEAL